MLKEGVSAMKAWKKIRKQQHKGDNLKRVPKDASGWEAKSLAEMKGRHTITRKFIRGRGTAGSNSKKNSLNDVTRGWPGHVWKNAFYDWTLGNGTPYLNRRRKRAAGEKLVHVVRRSWTRRSGLMRMPRHHAPLTRALVRCPALRCFIMNRIWVQARGMKSFKFKLQKSWSSNWKWNKSNWSGFTVQKVTISNY